MFALITASMIILLCSVGNAGIFSEGESLRIITREEWRDTPPDGLLQELLLPVPNAIIWHTSTNSCYNFNTCSNIVRIIQQNHMNKMHWWDIGFNFLIGGDGNVYEGRGWRKVGAHTYNWNNKSIGVAFIGTFDKTMPTPVQVEASKKLLEHGVSLGVLDKDYKLMGALQLSAASCPGQKLYQEIETWPHWASST